MVIVVKFIRVMFGILKRFETIELLCDVILDEWEAEWGDCGNWIFMLLVLQWASGRIIIGESRDREI